MTPKPEIKTILYASDLGGGTRPVFRHALDMAEHYDAKIIMVKVVEPMSDAARAVITSYLSKDVTTEMQQDVMKDILVRMKERVQTFYREEAPEGVYSARVSDAMVVAGKPSEEILRIAEEENADMIIMGKSTRKVRGIRVMGSTARRVSRMSTVPVLIVPNF